MADLTALVDVGHDWGGDVFASPSGDLQQVSRVEKSKERVIRRLLTNPGEMLFHPEYGGGIPRRVGTIVNAAEITAMIRTQMTLEASVAQTPAPVIVVTPTMDGADVSLNWAVLPEKEPASLSFSVDN